MALVLRAVSAAGDLVARVLNMLTDIFLTTPLQATLEHLEETQLTTLTAEKTTFQAKSLWEKTGAVIMAEASELSSLKPELDKLGVPLYAVVKENVGDEVQNFQPFFDGEIFLDQKRRFFGPRERRLGLLAFLRTGVWRNGLRAFGKGFKGNILGEGFVLGGVFVVGRDQQGILLEHREAEFGDHVNIEDVMQAVRKIGQELQTMKDVTE